MIIAVDTREVTPYKFKGFTVVNSKLVCGDYSILGFESEITIERKTGLDFLQSISHQRDRFKEELKRMMAIKHRFIVVEDTVDSLLNMTRPEKFKASKKGHVRPVLEPKIKMHPNSIYMTIISIFIRYQPAFYFAKNRAEGEKFTLSVLKRFYALKRSGEV